MALASGTLTAIAVVIVLIGNLLVALACLVGLTIAATGGWYFATSTRFRRAAGAGALVAGSALAIVALSASASVGVAIERIAVVLAGVTVTTIASRVAFRSPGRSVFVQRQNPQQPVLLCNPRSGGGKVAEHDLVARAEAMGVRTALLEPGVDLERLARDAVDAGADCLGMAGGDGSQALVASVAVDTGVPFVCIPAGTRNHFALDLGLNRDDPVSGLGAFHSGLERLVDYATVQSTAPPDCSSTTSPSASTPRWSNATSTATRRRRPPSTCSRRSWARMPNRSTCASRISTETPSRGRSWSWCRTTPTCSAPSSDLGQRRSMDSGLLGVFALSDGSDADVAALVALSALGARRRSPIWHEFTTELFEVGSSSGAAFLGVDGEALELDTPLRFRSHAGGLRMMVPADNPTAVRRRHARDVGLDDLVAIARGSGPPGGRHSHHARQGAVAGGPDGRVSS